MDKSIDQDDWDSLWNIYSEVTKANPAQKYRRKLIINEILKIKNRNNEKLDLVDIGCGQGDLLVELKNIFPDFNLTGIELSDSGVSICRKRIPSAEIIQANLLEKKININFTDNSMVGICSEVLEHVDNPLLLLINIKELINGHIIVTVPGGPMSSFDKLIGHRKHFNKKEILNLLDNAGFSQIKVYSSGFPFFNFYKLGIILKGKTLAQDIDSGMNEKKVEKNFRFIYHVFNFLFKFNLKNSIFGWQIIALAHT